MRKMTLALVLLAPLAGCEENPPEVLDNFSECMSKDSLECAGFYPDGWVGENTSCKLTQPKANVPLVVRGTVPMLPDAPAFSTELRVLVDNQEVARETLKPGDFDIRRVPPGGAGVRHVELRFSQTQRLPGGDDRSVGALLKSVGFGKGGG
jgi:hypothetical protein